MTLPVDRDQIHAEREELSRTVQALAAKLDIASRAREAAGTARRRGGLAWHRVMRSPLFIPVSAIVGAALAAGSAIWWSRR